ISLSKTRYSARHARTARSVHSPAATLPPRSRPCNPPRRVPMFRSLRVLRFRLAIAACLIVGSAPAVLAQSIVDARRGALTPSADRGARDPSGAPLVTSYQIDVYLAGGTTPVQSASLGKPAPDPDGFIRVDFVSLLATPLTPGTIYEARVSAVGPAGSSQSAVSNTFGFSLPCAPPPRSSSAPPPPAAPTRTLTAPPPAP